MVQSASIANPIVDGGGSVTLSATVRNRGDVAAEATVLRYYRSSNAIISTADTHVGSDSVASLGVGDSSNESVGLTAPSNAGTYYYGACVDSVAGESSTDNNCSDAVELTVRSQVPAVAPADQRAFDALFVGNYLSTPNYFIAFLSGGRFRESAAHPGGYTYQNTGPNTGTVTQTYDDTNQFGGSCTIELTFGSVDAGTLSYTCAGPYGGTEEWRRDTVDSGSFNIEIVWSTSRSSAVASAVQAAVSRWQSVMAANIPPAYVSTSSFFGIIDDIRIVVRIESIDGPGGTLGSAGPRVVRLTSGRPAISAIRLDRDDVSRISGAALRDLALHEMAHAFGFGTNWSRLGLLSNASANADPNAPLPDTHFTGANAIRAFDAAGGAGYTGAKVPVENTGGSGQANGHWRQSVFGDELMIGTFNVSTSGQAPMSAVTVQSMADLGYAINAGAADGYSLPSFSAPTVSALARAGTLDDGVPRQCIVMEPLPPGAVTVIELKSD